MPVLKQFVDHRWGDIERVVWGGTSAGVDMETLRDWSCSRLFSVGRVMKTHQTVVSSYGTLSARVKVTVRLLYCTGDVRW